MKYETEIWYLEVLICDDDFDYAIKILINWQNQSNSMTSSF